MFKLGTYLGRTPGHARWILAGLTAWALALLQPAPADAAPLTTLDYRVKGSQLTITPAALAVPKNIAGSVATNLTTAPPPGSFIEATLRGPSFPARRLVGAPNAPLLLPPLNLSGDYSLDGIRLADGTTNETLLEGTPASVPVQVFEEVLISRVTSRPLSLSEIQEKGIVIDENNFRAVEFEIGFVLDGQTFPVRFPVVTPKFTQTTEIIPAAELEERLAQVERINNELSQDVKLPPELEVSRPNISFQALNMQLTTGFSEELGLSVPPIPALMVIPGNIGFLNQFFSVQIFTENAAPGASGLSVRDITAELILPTGPDRAAGTFTAPGDDPVRFARTGPNAEIRNVISIQAAGADGQPGTPDDVGRLLPGQGGQGEFLVEGLQEGLHVMDLKLKAKLDGLAAGPVEVEGKAAGSVIVSNPKFSFAFSHPRTVRAGEPYDAFVTLLNTSQTVANLVSISLNPLNVSGSLLQTAERVEFPTLRPGETVTAKFSFISQRTGAITFSNITTSDDSLVGRLRLTTGVDERGVALSRNSLVLPDFVNELPAEVVSAANRVIGQALSVSTAAQLPPGVLRVPRSFISTGVVNNANGGLDNVGGGSVILQLAEAGQRVRYGESLSRVLPDLLLDWQGGRQFSDGWDQIIRSTDAGREWREALMRAMENADPAPDDPVSRLVLRGPDLAGRGETWFFAAVSRGIFQENDGALTPDGSELNLLQGPARAEVKTSAITKASGYGGREGAQLASGTAGIFEWKFGPALPGATKLSVLKTNANGTAREILWNLSDIAAGACARFDATGTGTGLEVDDNCDGTVDRTVAGAVSDFTEQAPRALLVQQDAEVKVARPARKCYTPLTTNDRNQRVLIENYGNILAVLFSKPMTQESAGLASAYQLDDGTEVAFVQVQPGGRVALLTLRRPMGALVPRSLAIGAGVTDLRGNAFPALAVPVRSRLVEGLSVRGRILRADGSGGAALPVTLTMNDAVATDSGCVPHDVRVAQVLSDREGNFAFEFVVSGIPFSLSTTDISAVRDNEAIAIILESSRDGAVTAERLNALGASITGSEETASEALRRAFGVASKGEAIALAEGLDRAVVSDFPPDSRRGGEGVYVLRFRGRGTVSGTVLAADGVTPVGGAAVNLFPDPDSRELGRGILSDAAGRFVFLGVPLGGFSMEATSPAGRQRTLSGLLAAAGETVDLPVVLGASVAPLTSIQGRVTEPDGAPHNGASVFVKAEPIAGVEGPTLATATADEQGFWTASRVQAGPVKVIAISRDGRRKGERQNIAAVQGAVNTVNVTLQARATVRGKVEFSNGDPVAGAIVGGGEALVTTDALGAFTLEGVPTGPDTKIAAGLAANPDSADPRRRFARLGSASLSVLPGGNNFAVIRFTPAGRIAGQVLDETGRAVPDVNVALPLEIDETQGSFLWVKADAAGLFTFDNLGLGKYDLSAPAPPVDEFDADKAQAQIRSGDQDQIETAIKAAFAAFTGAGNPFLNGQSEKFNPTSWGFVEDVPLRFDGETVIVPVRFLPKATISGVVKNGQGVPIGAKVRLTGVGPKPNGEPTLRVKADLDSDPALGTFAFNGVAFVGGWGLQAASPFFPVVVSASGRTTQVDPVVRNVLLQFPAVRETSGTLIGEVLNADGTAVGSNVRVQISPPNDFFVRTDTTGTFRTNASGLQAGNYSVIALDEATGATGQAGVIVTAGQENRVTVRMLGRGLAKVLVRKADGTPAAGAAVEIEAGGFPGGRFDGTADVSGEIVFSNLFEGNYAGCASLTIGGTRVAGRTSLTVPAGGTGEGTISLGGTATVRGVFVGTDGRTPIPFANASLSGLAVSPTDAEGRFALTDVPLGTHRLTVTDSTSGRSGALSLTLGTNGEIREVTVVETPLGRVFGLVTNGAGNGPVSNAEVTLQLEDSFATNRRRTVTTAPDGSFSFAAVPAGAFELNAKDAVSGLSSSAKASLASTGGSLEVNLPLQATATVIVQVVEPDGITPADAAVRMPVGFRTVSADTGADGRVRFENVRIPSAGEALTVSAASRVAGQTRSLASGTVPPLTRGGGETIKLTLRGVGTVQGRVLLADGATVAPGAEVLVAFPDGGTETVIASAGGGFSFPNLPVGPVTLTAFSQALGAQTTVTLTAHGSIVTQDLTLTASGTFSGRLVRADGTTPGAGGDVIINFTSASNASGTFAARVGADGRFHFSPVTVGTFTINASLPAVNGIARTAGTLSTNGQVMDLPDLLLDEAPPVVVSSVPAATSADVDINANLEVLFSEALEPSSIEASGIFVRKAGGGEAIAASLSLVAPAGESARRRLILDPAAPLESETAYQLIVVDGELKDAVGAVTNRGPRDLVGRSLPVLFSVPFTTRDQRPPVLLSFTPENGASGVGARTPLRLSFDEPVQPGTVVTLTGPGGPVAGTTSLGVNSLVLTFVPEADLPPNTTFTANVSGVKDLAGNALADQPLQRSFATLDTLGPVITQLRLKNNQVPVANGAITLQAVLAAAEPGVRLRLSADNVTVATSTENVLEVPFTLPASGTITFRGIAIDRAGNEGPLAELRVTIQENQAPQIQFTRLNPVTGPVLSGSGFAVRVNATDDGAVTELRAAATGAAAVPFQTSPTGPVNVQGVVPATAQPGSTVTIVALATDNSGTASGQQTLSLTVADGTAPAVAFTGPAENALIIPASNPDVQVQWSENSGAATLRIVLSGAVTGTVERNVTGPANTPATVSLTLPLSVAPPDGGTFTATLTATDAAGRSSTTTRSFTLPDSRSPQLASLSPVNGAGSQSLWTEAVLSFNKAMKPETFTPANLEFPGAFTVTPNGTNTSFTLRSASALAPGQLQSLRLKPGLTDAAGNPWQDTGGVPVDPAGKLITFTTATFTAVSPPSNFKVVPGQSITARADFQAGLGADQIAFTTLAVEATQNVNPSTATTASATLILPLTATNPETLFVMARRSGRPSFTLPGIPLDIRPRTGDDDGDGIPNGQESDLGLDPFFDDRTLDPDADGRNNAQEILSGTNPNDPDSDDDGLNDGTEFTGGTNPLLADTDGDGIGNLTDRRPLIANAAPVPQNDAVTVPPGESTPFPEQVFLTNDTDPDGDTLRVDSTFPPTVLHGTALYAAVPRVFTYTPEAGFRGVDTLTYRVVDEGGLTATATVAITVGDNTRPVAGSLIFSGGGALRFDGIDDVVKIPEFAALDLSRRSAWTISAWVLPGSITHASFPTIYSEGRWMASLGLDQNDLLKLDSWRNNSIVVTGNGGVRMGDWQHVAVTFDGATKRFYLNGVFNGSADSGPTSADDNGSSIGNVTSSFNSSGWQGLIDEVAIWSRVLDDAEMGTAALSLLGGTEAGLAGLWHFNETTGNAALNSVSGSPDGVLGGGTVLQVPTREPNGAPISGFRSEYSIVQDAMTPLVLSGSDSDGNALTARLKSLPSHGRLFQRATGGGPGTEITLAPAIVSDAGRLVFYQPAEGFLGDDSFAYTVHDGIDESHPALALLHVAAPIPPQSNDVWDISQGAVVTNSTGFLSNSTGDNMFGANVGVEPGNAIFADGRPAGFTHAVEWRTTGLVQLEGARVFATQGGDTQGQRTFTEMRLFGRADAATAFIRLATFRPGENPYFSPVRSNLFFAPFVGQEFRAEFDQFGNFAFPGPRIEELDAIGETVVLVPVPVTVQLQNATADRTQGSFSVAQLIDGIVVGGTHGWAGDVGGTPPMTAVFEAARNIQATADTKFVFGMPQPFGSQHFVGNFRISATTDARDTFADGLNNGGDIAANWTVLQVTKVTSTGGETLEVLPDGSVLVGGTMPSTTSYTVETKGITGGVTGFRLELLEHPSLPNNGPGRVGHGNWVLAEFTVQADGTVPQPNRAPVAAADAAQTPQGFPVTTVNVLANDADPEGDAVTVLDFTQPAAGKGSVVGNNNGTFTYTPPDAAFTGTAAFTYRITDTHQTSKPATVTITVNATNIIVWNNPTGGNWSTASNWLPARVPGPDDNAVVSLQGTYTVTLGTEAAPLSLSVGGDGVTATLRQTNGTLAPAQASTIAAGSTYQLEGGTLRGTSTLSINGTLSWTGGTMREAGKTLIASGGTGTIRGGNGKDLSGDRVFENAGILTISGGPVFFNLSNQGGGAVISNLAGGTLEVQGETDFAHNFASPGSAINNAGLFRKTGGGTTDLSSNAVALNNTGTVEIVSGRLKLNAGGNSSSGINVQSEGRLQLNGGTLTMPAGASLGGSGLLELSAGSGVFQNTLGLGKVVLDGGDWSFNAPQTFASLTQSGGTLRGTGTVTLSNVFTWTGGVMREAGRTLIAPGATGTISGGNGKDLSGDRVFENAGILTVSGAAIFFNLSNLGGGAIINNLAGGTLEVQGETDFAHNFASPGSAINNAGLFRKTGGGTTDLSSNAVALNNTGTVEIINGRLKLNAGGNSSGGIDVQSEGRLQLNGGTLTMPAGAILNGSGLLELAAGSGVFQNTLGLGKVVLDGGDWSFSAPQTFASLTQNGGALRGTGAVTITGAFAWTGGVMREAGRTLIASGATGTISGGNGKDLSGDRVFENAGILTVSGAAIFFNLSNLGAGAVINNLPGAILEVQGETDFAHNFASPGSAINNAGLFRKTGGGTTDLSSNVVALNNTGTVEIINGRLKLNAGGNSSGGIDVQSEGRLQLNGGTLTMPAGASLGGAGLLELTAGTGVFQNTLGLAKAVMDGGDWSFSAPQTFASLTQNGGALRGTGAVTITGALAWTGGTMREAGKTLIALGATATISGGNGKDLSGGRILENAGTLTISGGTVFFNLNNLGGGAIINNLAGAILEVAGETDFNHNFASPGSAINNAGLFRKTGGGTTDLSASAVALNNTGTIALISGNLRPRAGFAQNGILEGTGTIFGNLTNNGTVKPSSSPGGLTVDGNYTQTSTGLLSLTLRSPDPLSGHRSFTVNGVANFNGGIELALKAGFAETLSARFPIVSFASRSGDFVSSTGLTDNFGYTFSRAFTGTTLELTVAVAGSVPPDAAGALQQEDFAAWMNRQAALAGVDAALEPLLDPDRDGLSNLVEYAFGTNPFDVFSSFAPVPALLHEQSGDTAVLEFRRRKDSNQLHYEIIQSTDLRMWLPADDLRELDAAPIDDQAGMEMVRIAVLPALQKTQPCYLALRITLRAAPERIKLPH